MNVGFLMAHNCTSQIAAAFCIPFCLFSPLCVLPFFISLAPPLFAVSLFGSFCSYLRCFLHTYSFLVPFCSSSSYFWAVSRLIFRCMLHFASPFVCFNVFLDVCLLSVCRIYLFICVICNCSGY